MNRAARAFGLILLVIGAGIGIWTLFPLPRKTIESQVTFQGNTYTLTFSAPTVLRAGEASEAMLKLAPPPHSPPPTTKTWWQARLISAGFEIYPSGESSQPLTPNKATVFRWELRAPSPTRGECALWVHALYTPQTGKETRFTIFTTSWKVKTQWLGGLSAFTARVLAVVALLVGFVALRATNTNP